MVSLLVAITKPRGLVISYRGWYSGVRNTEWCPVDWPFRNTRWLSECLAQIVGIISKVCHQNLYILFFKFIVDDHKPFVAT